jgi:alpha-1,3-rhamnosyltransferase
LFEISEDNNHMIDCTDSLRQSLEPGLTLKMPKEKILVSVIVMTFNSANYVLETLDSILIQTYKNIELIVTDDGSKDKTIEFCEKWLYKHANHFVETKLIRSKQNTGIPANCNRGIKESSGEWIKIIAGDDILFPDAIRSLVKNINSSSDIYFGKIGFFISDEKSSDRKIDRVEPTKRIERFFNLTSGLQNKLLKFSNFLPAPSSFIRKSLLIRLGYFDERFFLCEDHPFWLKATKNGAKLGFCDEFVAYYRVNHNNVTNKVEKYYNIKLHKCKMAIYKNIIIPDSNLLENLFVFHFLFIEMLRFNILTRHFKNCKSKRGNFFSAVLSFFSIVHWIEIFLKYGVVSVFSRGFRMLKREYKIQN